jgi:sigma-B regulation protein RsbU (phosphoserine phosphatase)
MVPNIAGCDIAESVSGAEEIGGSADYQLRAMNRGLRMFRHGIASALVMTAFRGLLRIHSCGSRGLAKIARTLNRQLPQFTGNSHFVTALYGVLYPASEEFTYICCGHQQPLVIHSDGNVSSLKEHGPALGILDDVAFPTGKLSLVPGDIMLLYTDGVVELGDQAGTEFGIGRLVSAIHQNRDLRAGELIQMVIHATQQFSGYQSYVDDFTLVVIQPIKLLSS